MCKTSVFLILPQDWLCFQDTFHYWIFCFWSFKDCGYLFTFSMANVSKIIMSAFHVCSRLSQTEGKSSSKAITNTLHPNILRLERLDGIAKCQHENSLLVPLTQSLLTEAQKVFFPKWCFCFFCVLCVVLCQKYKIYRQSCIETE